MLLTTPHNPSQSVQEN
jgi:hypothetical protein